MAKNRLFFPLDFVITDQESVTSLYQNILAEEFGDIVEFKTWLAKVNELENIVSEDYAWRYIKMTCDTANKDIEEQYLDFVNNIQPAIAPLENQIHSKIAASPFIQELSKEKAYELYFRSIQTSLNLYREENIELYTKVQNLSQEYGAISGGLSIEWEGKELTLQQASVFLKNQDREIRKQVWIKIQQKRLDVAEKLDSIFSELVLVRNQIGIQAGEDNFRDYMFKSLGRFDYSVQDCFQFHEAIQKIVVPLKKKLHESRKHKLKLQELKPWDLSVDPENKEPLKPFENGTELLNKTIECFANIDPYFAECIQTMEKMGHLDLESRKGKAPGGYNYPLSETGIPFIFMNAAGLHRDVETMVHEGGHAIHSFLTKDLELNAFKNTPSEVAELASMSMELISMNNWSVFYSPEDQKRAIREQLEGIIFTLPWIATIDAFQHWIYTNPNHSKEERKVAWKEISSKYDTDTVNWSELELYREFSWHAQLHLFEVPFYYIEYGFAQLGALGIWKNFKKDSTKALENYKNALSLGYTQSIPTIYETAGVKFDFTEKYIQELFAFLEKELDL
jgi:oligoendopeptidase F